MIRTRLGNDGPFVSAIGLGTWGLGGRFTADARHDDLCVDAIRMGLDLGLTLIDTAEAYGAGHTERLVGRAIRGRRSDVCVATKVSPENLRPEDVVRAAEGSLGRLGIDCIDLYQVHWPNSSVPIEATLEAMDRLIEQGKIRFIGLSNFGCRGLAKALSCAGHPVVALQTEYNLFDRTIENDLLPFCRKAGIGLIAYSPLDQGHSPTKGRAAETLAGIAEKHGRTVVQVILNWLARVQGVVPIPKAGNPVHLRENAAALDFALDEEDVAAVDLACAPRPAAIPAWRVRADTKGLENFVPGPDDLARDIVAGEAIKPIRVVPAPDDPSRFDLVEGKLRYWAWVKAMGAERAVPALVRQTA